jgi:hypothetical protein
MVAPPLVLKKASANVLGAPVCTVRLRPLWCCGCSVVSRSQEVMNQNQGRHRVMPIAGGTGNPQQRTHVRVPTVHLWWSVRRSLHISYLGWWRGSWAQDWLGWGVKADTHGGLLNDPQPFTRPYLYLYMLPMAGETNASVSCSLSFVCFPP